MGVKVDNATFIFRLISTSKWSSQDFTVLICPPMYPRDCTLDSIAVMWSSIRSVAALRSLMVKSASSGVIWRVSQNFPSLPSTVSRLPHARLSYHLLMSGLAKSLARLVVVVVLAVSLSLVESRFFPISVNLSVTSHDSVMSVLGIIVSSNPSLQSPYICPSVSIFKISYYMIPRLIKMSLYMIALNSVIRNTYHTV